jgi:hypothetical protein
VEPATLAKLLHIAAVIVFITGLIGRSIVLSHAARATNLSVTSAFLEMSSIFERMVVQGYIAVLVLGLATAWLQSQPVLGALQGSAVNWILVSLVLFVSINVLVPTIFIPSGKKFAAALAAAIAVGAPTPELRERFADRGVRVGHIYEFVVVAVVLVLMVLKPF